MTLLGLQPVKINIKSLRQLGGTWRAIQCGFGNYWYEGIIGNDTFEVKSYAHLAPRYDGDDDSFVIKWHTYKNGKEISVGFDPISVIHKELKNAK